MILISHTKMKKFREKKEDNFEKETLEFMILKIFLRITKIL